MRKALFTCVVSTNNYYSLSTFSVPVEDPTLREMAEYMEANRYETGAVVDVVVVIMLCHIVVTVTFHNTPIARF